MSDQVRNPEDRFSHNEAHILFLFNFEQKIPEANSEDPAQTPHYAVSGSALFSYVPKVHYENTPIRYTVRFQGCKNNYFQMKNCDIFLIFAQNIDCGYTLEPPQ